jgi:ribosomal protein RSM22 (predicted rRNA methylase)
MTDRTPLPEQLDVIERMLARAKAEKDWHAIPALKATADLIRWTMATADTLKAAAAVVRHPAVRGGACSIPRCEDHGYSRDELRPWPH